MTNPAGRLQLAMELYDAGMLCKCRGKDLIQNEDGFWRYELKHHESCEGKAKLQVMLMYKDENEVQSE